MNQGKYVFSQVMEFFPRWVFEKAVKKYAGDFHAKSLNSYSHCLHLMFGQMAGCKSLKDISLVLKSLKKSVYHLGIPTAVDSSSLSRANEVRDYRIFEELGMWLINKVRPMYAKENIPDVYLPGWEIFAIDSTTIPCSIKLAEWALGKYSKGGVKMHTVLDLRGSIPETIYVTDSRWHDSNFLDVYEPYKWAIYTMDKAYVDFEALYRMQLHKTYFITRAKDTMKYEVVNTNYNIDDLASIVGDQIIHLSGYISEKKYPEDLRLVKFYDAENDEVISFITNNMELGPLVIANIYRNRWQIETFFKWIKGNLTVKLFWGYSENAVKIHLWVAISSYLLLAWIKAALKSPLTITEVSKVVEVSILSKADIRELLDVQIPLTKNQNVNELVINF
ncbi:MAG TPA: IS4 family transposase [Bacteroidaceae bacterium]|jgi:hypothetical protein|nr:IS4 family transposase [Bacteroidaceae bacterium]